MPYMQHLLILRAALGIAAPWRVPVPTFVMLLAARAGDLVPRMLFHTAAWQMLQRGQAADPADTESLLGLVYYRRRSPRHDADVVFPLAWHVRDDASRTFVLGPLAHREAPGEHDNWIAPLAFTGARADGGYFHFPLLLTSSHWNAKSAFTLVGPYFRDRTGTDVDLGVAPLFFRGDNGDVEGGRKTYTLIPPLLYYHREREAEESSFTVVGPVITQIGRAHV